MLARHVTSPELDSSIEGYPERANLYRIEVSPRVNQLYLVKTADGGKSREEVFFGFREGGVAVEPRVREMRQLLRREVRSALERAGYKLGRPPQSLIVDTKENHAPKGSALRMHAAFEWRVMWFDGRYYLCLDYHLRVQSLLTLAKLGDKYPSFQPVLSQQVLFRSTDDWHEGTLVHAGTEISRVITADEEEVEVRNVDVVPQLSPGQVDVLAPAFGVAPNDLEQRIKKLSFLVGSKAALARFDACNEFAKRLATEVFPIISDKATISLDGEPAVLRPPAFQVNRDLVEPEAAFDHVDQSKRAGDIREGLLSFGSYERSVEPLRLVLLGTKPRIDLLTGLVNRINQGSYRFRGTDPTFGSRLEVREVLEARDVEGYEECIRRFVRGPKRQDVDLTLVYLPKAGNTADWGHPYFRTKAALLQEGLPSQMVDERTIQDPRWKDLGLSLKMYAKAGFAPWVLDEALPGVDIFIGLSSSFVKQNGRIQRTVGYVNVFDNYGRWRFYHSEIVPFPFEDRIPHYDDLVKRSLAGYQSEHGGEVRNIHFHQTKPFSADERRALAESVRAVVPDAQITFVHVNVDHILRLYDLHSPDARIGRATYLIDDPRTVYLTTTGANAFGQLSMGTPIPLALSVHCDPEVHPDLRTIAQQILSLTRLNWASSHSFCHEPITTKFAGRIAYLMNAFMQDPYFQVNASLRATPWFL